MTNFKDLLDSYNISREEFAAFSGLSVQTIDKASLGKRIGIETQNKIRISVNKYIKLTFGAPVSFKNSFLFKESEKIEDRKNIDQEQPRIFIEDRNEIEIVFIDKQTPYSLKELSKALAGWSKILYSFARVANSNETDFRIVNIRKGSVIATIATVAGTVAAIGVAINQILNAINTSLQIKKSSLDLKKLNNPALEGTITDLEKRSVIDKEKESIEIANLVVNNYNSPDKEEVQNGLKYSVVKLFDFISDGGEVTLKISSKENDFDTKSLLDDIKVAFEQRKLNEGRLDELEKGIEDPQLPGEE